jgi:hypothetical protein
MMRWRRRVGRKKREEMKKSRRKKREEVKKGRMK